MAGKFEKIHDRLSNSGLKGNHEKSREWFLRTLRHMRNISRGDLLTDARLIRRKTPRIGRMMMFMYDPKTKETLPYYDRFPLIIMVEPTKDGFYGLNLHYLPIRLRAIFFDELLDTINNKRYNESTRFKLTYSLLKGSQKMRFFRPCFKRYLHKHVVSKVAEVPPEEWEIALFIPSQDFVKESQKKIWQDSRKMVS